MGDLGLKTNKTDKALEGFTNAYWYSRSVPEQALQFNQKIADVPEEQQFAKSDRNKTCIVKGKILSKFHGTHRRERLHWRGYTCSIMKTVQHCSY